MRIIQQYTPYTFSTFKTAKNQTRNFNEFIRKHNTHDISRTCNFMQMQCTFNEIIAVENVL